MLTTKPSLRNLHCWLAALALAVSGCASEGTGDELASQEQQATVATLAISPATADFGTVVVGAGGASMTFVVSNVGTASSGSLTPTLGGSSASSFTLSGGCAGIVLAPSATCAVNVLFNPSSAGAKSAALTVSATPGGVVSASLTGMAVAPALLAISPVSQDFGTVVVGGAAATATFTVTNTGGLPSGAIAAALGGSATSQFAIVGSSCAGAALAPAATCTVTVRFSPTSAGAKSATLAVSAAPGGTVVATLSGTAVSPGVLVLNPTMYNFGTVVVGAAAPMATFTVSNAGGMATGPISVTVSGSSAGMFQVTSSTCTGVGLAPAATCTIQVRFNPASVGAHAASLSVAATPGASAVTTMTGTAIAPAQLAVSPSAQDFGTVVAGTSSAQVTFTVTNTGGLPSGTVSGALVGGDGSFAMVTNACSGMTLAPAASCTLSVRFSPTTAGSKLGTLSVSAAPGGTAAVALTGTALASGTLVISPSTQDFGTVVMGTSTAEVTFTVTNAGGTPTGIAAVALGGTSAGSFQLVSSTCVGVSLAPAATCTATVRFAPSTAGAHAATLSVTATPGGVAVASLMGTAIAPATLTIGPSPANFGTIGTGTSSPQVTFTVSNNGGLTSGAIAAALSGVDPASFAVVTNSCAGATLAPAATCVLSVRFSPTSAGNKSATLVVSAAPGGSAAAALMGTAVSPGTLIINPTSQNFGTVVIGSSGPTATFTITNAGGTPTGLATVALGGTSAAAFVVTSSTCASVALAPAATCTVTVRFNPAVSGAHAATLSVSATPGGSAVASLSGIAITPAQLTITPANTNFGSVVLGTSSTTRTFTVSNSGGLVSGVVSVTLGGGDVSSFAITSTSCSGITLAPAATCTVNVRFSPAVRGNRTANLLVSATPGGTAVAALSGTGQAPAQLAINPTSYNFGAIRVGYTSATVIFTVSNLGDVVTTVPSATLSGLGASSFTGSTSCTAALAPGATCQISLRFRPGSVGAKAAAVQVTATTGGSAVASLSGTGTL